MPRSLLSLRTLSILVTTFAVFIGVELWLHDLGPAAIVRSLPIKKPLEAAGKQMIHDAVSPYIDSDGDSALGSEANDLKSSLLKWVLSYPRQVPSLMSQAVAP